MMLCYYAIMRILTTQREKQPSFLTAIVKPNSRRSMTSIKSILLYLGDERVEEHDHLLRYVFDV